MPRLSPPAAPRSHMHLVIRQCTVISTHFQSDQSSSSEQMQDEVGQCTPTSQCAAGRSAKQLVYSRVVGSRPANPPKSLSKKIFHLSVIVGETSTMLLSPAVVFLAAPVTARISGTVPLEIARSGPRDPSLPDGNVLANYPPCAVWNCHSCKDCDLD